MVMAGNHATAITEREFLPDEAKAVLMSAIESVLNNEVYEVTKVPQWIDKICDRCIHGLVKLQKPFKYIVSAAILQNNGASFCAAHSAYWDIVNDNFCQVSWPAEKIRDQHGSRMQCVVTAFGLSL